MKRFLLLAVLWAAITALPTGAADKSTYQIGKLVDLRRESTGSGAARAQGSFCLVVQVGDVAYLVRQEANWRWSYEPTDFVVGDPVEVRIKGKDLYLKKAKGGDFKTNIARRERVSKEPPTCGTPITTN